ncbi:glutamic acid-rich protein-like, partial [Branchiostoma floridae]|uniref:Glutamic acid-rich protein-like n=1 Tax=Branchiostoma floridae TaxID=7739 RepID=A0A9J7M712_BRAFL
MIEVGGVNHCKLAEENLIDRPTSLEESICEIDTGNDDSVMMISYHDYLSHSQSEAEEEEDDKVTTDVIDLENNDPEDSNNVGDIISYSDFLKGGIRETKDAHHTEDVKIVDETSNPEIPYEDFVKNMGNTTTENNMDANDVSKQSGELLSGSPNSSGQGKMVTVEAQVHCLTEEGVSKKKPTELLKQGKRASTPKTKGRKKSNVVIEEVDLVIEESNDSNKKVNEERAKIQKSITAARNLDPETRARNEEIKKNFMANFRQPAAKKKAAEAEEKNEESAKEEQEKETEDAKADKNRSVKSLPPASKSNTRVRKPASKKALEEKEDKEEESPVLKKTAKSDRKNAKKKATEEDTASTKVKKKTDNKATRKKKDVTAKEAESVEVVEPEVQETPTRTTRSGRKCVYRSQLLTLGFAAVDL